MSAPEHRLAAPARRQTAPATHRPRPPARAPEPVAPGPLAPSPRPATRRRRHHLGFAILSGVLVGSLVLGIVVLHVLLAQQSFRIAATEHRLEALGAEQLQLVRKQATLSAPGRIARWATRHGMRLPDDIRILRAPNGPSDPAGAGSSTTTTSAAAEG